MRAIDGDALKETIQEYICTLYHDDRPDLDYEYINIDDLNWAIDSAPTVTEAQIDNSTYLSIYNEGYLAGLKERAKTKDAMGKDCSNCGAIQSVIETFCSKCGAKR